MGGSAFAQAAAQGQPTLHTPRMSPAEYAHLKTTYLRRLQECFPGKAVSVLVEAPEKTDYGDLDLFVVSDGQVDFIDVARKLGAAGVICSSSGKHQMCSIGVLKDGSRSSHETVVYKNISSNNSKKAQPSTTVTVEEYAQIDIEVISSEDFRWHSFYSSYGDMGALLGNITRNLGLTISDKGLVLRLKELDYAKKTRLEQVADKDGMLILSNDPDRVMAFLGLSFRRYAEGFATVSEFFRWLRECRLIDLNIIRKKRNISRDRQKESKRTLYSKFFEEWLPKSYGIEDEESDTDDQVCDSPQEEPRDDDRMRWEKRERLRDEAVKFFDKEEEYRTMFGGLQRLICNLWVERLLKPIIAAESGAKDKKLAEIVRAFRRWVCFLGGTKPCVLPEPHSDAESQLFWFLKSRRFMNNPDLAQSFVAEHWEELKTLERRWAKGSREVEGTTMTG
ncbi:hypothetical protein M409DRAFT_63986 [Zasmidium cellare ATCC 36951]|uniref:Uncharacterized protein n=1 Tax=Zasmidium cellare ATCC 36951 TaxID=1080233 RepID=A0A6A6CXN8_ZASCE|nr:uncharacterized protein M409DRAFT_63986 [Zasmidium cellare ATCC 36951]KAF2170988.1 hypothetical protein M409DRAFT_63986 [Zasmidium cellare ATCC 36951]